MKYQHHHSVLDTLQAKLDWWRKETTSTTERETEIDRNRETDRETEIERETESQRTSGISRCSRCWLRCYDCCCSSFLQPRRDFYSSAWQTLQRQYSVDVEVLLFYHVMELGRSANTAHVFEYLCDEITKTIVYGNVEDEEELIGSILKGGDGQQQSRQEFTCLLYPCPEAMSLNQWIDSHFPAMSHPVVDLTTSKGSSESVTPAVRPLVRMIILDGTYPRAKHMMKFFKACKQEFNLDKRHLLDFVQLDLDLDKGIKSAVAGVMYQPAKDKICSYQATVIAIRQLFYILEERHKLAGASVVDFIGNQVCSELEEDLKKWIVYILKHKIKYGKPTPRKSLIGVDNQLPEHLQDVLDALPAHIYDPVLIKEGRNNRRLLHKLNDNNLANFNGNIRLVPTRKFAAYNVVFR